MSYLLYLTSRRLFTIDKGICDFYGIFLYFIFFLQNFQNMSSYQTTYYYYSDECLLHILILFTIRIIARLSRLMRIYIYILVYVFLYYMLFIILNISHHIEVTGQSIYLLNVFPIENLNDRERI